MSEPLYFTETEAEEFGLLIERFAFALRAFGIKDGPLLDRALSDATRAAWLVLQADVEAREKLRARLKVVE